MLIAPYWMNTRFPICIDRKDRSHPPHPPPSLLPLNLHCFLKNHSLFVFCKQNTGAFSNGVGSVEDAAWKRRRGSRQEHCWYRHVSVCLSVCLSSCLSVYAWITSLCLSYVFVVTVYCRCLLSLVILSAYKIATYTCARACTRVLAHTHAYAKIHKHAQAQNLQHTHKNKHKHPKQIGICSLCIICLSAFFVSLTWSTRATRTVLIEQFHLVRVTGLNHKQHHRASSPLSESFSHTLLHSHSQSCTHPYTIEQSRTHSRTHTHLYTHVRTHRRFSNKKERVQRTAPAHSNTWVSGDLNTYII